MYIRGILAIIHSNKSSVHCIDGVAEIDKNAKNEILISNTYYDRMAYIDILIDGVLLSITLERGESKLIPLSPKNDELENSDLRVSCRHGFPFSLSPLKENISNLIPDFRECNSKEFALTIQYLK